MFGRRVPPHIVFAFSAILAVLCAVGAVLAVLAHGWVWVAVAGVMAVWFAVDAVRSYGWAQNKKALDAEKAARKAQNHPQR
ncbi:hypothetical protein E7T09_09970 [Deinococcus sp. KSM4-11]|uniref:hypothetical protein n=1 Tax=Deinococcus sp. KSM4-11 TaxID=2568654 RepID=UPI0010A3E76C|nr:hypothetical protein [Deinococcus sp. KSM4-11]THF86447.1 hypothetical protein E7T09_09970 [Deinococcus sp. KSM4-11]